LCFHFHFKLIRSSGSTSPSVSENFSYESTFLFAFFFFLLSLLLSFLSTSPSSFMGVPYELLFSSKSSVTSSTQNPSASSPAMLMMITCSLLKLTWGFNTTEGFYFPFLFFRNFSAQISPSSSDSS
jgi:hypothetical protein